MSAEVKLDTAPLDALEVRLRELVESRLQVGLFGADPSRPDNRKGAAGAAPDLTTAQVGAFHEFGMGVPERSFLRSTARAEGRKVGELLGKATAKVIAGDPVPRALGLVGEVFTNMVRKTITSRIPPPLAEATLQKKTVGGKVGDVPLIDTGQLVQSIAPRIQHGQS